MEVIRTAAIKARIVKIVMEDFFDGSFDDLGSPTNWPACSGAVRTLYTLIGSTMFLT